LAVLKLAKAPTNRIATRKVLNVSSMLGRDEFRDYEAISMNSK
jgi:hypothetical protein